MRVKQMLPNNGLMRTDYFQSQILQDELFNLGYKWNGLKEGKKLNLDYDDFAIIWKGSDKVITWTLIRHDDHKNKSFQLCKFEDYFELTQ